MSETVTGAQMAQAVEDYRAHANGSNGMFKHWLGLKFTSGMQLVAETCGAHWLLDLIASHQPRLRRFDFQVWKLYQSNRRNPNRWTAECWTDSPCADGSRRLIQQRIEYSDFPPELAPFECWVEYGTAMLKEER